MSGKILVVDDEPATLKLIESLLNSKGFEVDSAKDGLDALVKIQKSEPDLVILDVEMPEINGYDVCYQLRFNAQYEKIPIILLTKRNQEIDDKIGERVNICYVPKPIDTELLFERIEALLS